MKQEKRCLETSKSMLHKISNSPVKSLADPGMQNPTKIVSFKRRVLQSLSHSENLQDSRPRDPSQQTLRQRSWRCTKRLNTAVTLIFKLRDIPCACHSICKSSGFEIHTSTIGLSNQGVNWINFRDIRLITYNDKINLHQLVVSSTYHHQFGMPHVPRETPKSAMFLLPVQDWWGHHHCQRPNTSNFNILCTYNSHRLSLIQQVSHK